MPEAFPWVFPLCFLIYKTDGTLWKDTWIQNPFSHLAKLPRAQLPIGHCEAAPQNLGKPRVMVFWCFPNVFPPFLEKLLTTSNLIPGSLMIILS